MLKRLEKRLLEMQRGKNGTRRQFRIKRLKIAGSNPAFREIDHLERENEMLRQENDRLRNEKYILKHPEVLKEKHFIEVNNHRLGR